MRFLGLDLYRRPLIPGERDPELLWGSVLLVSALAVFAWMSLGLPTPLCPLHVVTGIPCPTCGLTRGLGCLLHGNLMEAFLFNPLLMVLLLGAGFYLLYAGVVVIGRLPRLRWEPLSRRTSVCVRVGVALLVAANWVYLLWKKV